MPSALSHGHVTWMLRPRHRYSVWTCWFSLLHHPHPLDVGADAVGGARRVAVFVIFGCECRRADLQREAVILQEFALERQPVPVVDGACHRVEGYAFPVRARIDCQREPPRQVLFHTSHRMECPAVVVPRRDAGYCGIAVGAHPLIAETGVAVDARAAADVPIAEEGQVRDVADAYVGVGGIDHACPARSMNS